MLGNIVFFGILGAIGLIIAGAIVGIVGGSIAGIVKGFREAEAARGA